ncbi:hypothetical protein [Bosea sp. (in: a-proteobacteria)]|uniref:hypothetical protein n=1 Tax=Bosea sp. (in: a-proteobacteria) TaxID=1871050 RepID=UPI002FC617EE
MTVPRKKRHGPRLLTFPASVPNNALHWAEGSATGLIIRRPLASKEKSSRNLPTLPEQGPPFQVDAAGCLLVT